MKSEELKAFFTRLAEDAAKTAPKSEPKPAPTSSGPRRTVSRPAAGLPQSMQHWEEVSVPRFPFIPEAVQFHVAQWIREVDHGDLLVESGERVLPLLLNGETRCGKTSLASVIGRARDLTVYRMNLANAVGSYLGETAKKVGAALSEAASRKGLWLVDEIDAVASKRNVSGGAEQERAHAVGTLLTKLEQLPPTLALIATTNHIKNIDPAVLGRFYCVDWPRWEELPMHERRAFLDAQCGHDVHETVPQSYADGVKLARAQRVFAILDGADDKQLDFGAL